MSTTTIKIDPAIEKRLAEGIARFKYDAYGFVKFVFPWGVKGSSLERKQGPEKWQADLLHAVSAHRLDNYYRREMGFDYKVFRSAIASGHGVGKSTLVSWIIIWLMSTSMDTRGVVTANTANQLQTKTWPELGKWYHLMIHKHWFTWTSSSFYYARYPEDKQKNYKVDALTVSPENTEAWAGLHNETGVVFIIFDEASGVDHALWDVAEGAFTDGEPFFFVFGNPTQPDGDFADCFLNDPDRRWYKKHVDSREVSHTNKGHLNDIIKRNGIDSDFVRIRVLGTFPSRAYDGFISPDSVTTAMNREAHYDSGVAVVLGCDIARFGDDENVIAVRQGTDARSIPWRSWRGVDTMQTALRIAEIANELQPDGIIIESIGPGVGVIDILRSWNIKVLEIHPGAASSMVEFLNLRAEGWSKMREWIENRGCLPTVDGDLFKQLTTIRYALARGEGALQMEAKKSMKDRGLSSPDKADALMLTFLHNVSRRDSKTAASRRGAGSTRRAKVDYDDLGLDEAA